MKRTNLLAGLIPLLMAVGAACAKPQAATPDQLDQAAAKGDTVALARMAYRQCGSKSGTDRQSCYEDFFVQLARGDRVHISLGALASLASDHSDIEKEGHSFTHIIGIRAWQPGSDVGSVFRRCNGLFQSGCYHGVIQAYLTQGGKVDSSRAVRLCDEIAGKESDRWLRFQCVHGLGHGFEMAWNWEVPKALKGCDWLRTGWDKSSCYGGVFMENAVASMPGGHHTSVHALAAAPAKKDTAMAGHEHADMAEHAPDLHAITFKMRDSSDALYPCTIVEEQYQFSCYQGQGGIILAAVRGDFGRAMTQCNRATPINRSQCYVSLGTMSSGITIQNTGKSIAHCLHGDPQYQPFCFSGVVKNFIDVTAKAEDGIAFCKEVPPGANRSHCYMAVGEEIAVLHSADPPAREKACLMAQPDGEPQCRLGAQLPLKGGQ